MLKQIFQENSTKIGLTYCITICEFSIFASMPFVVGKTIDALINNQTYYIIFYIAILSIALTIGTFRRCYDTRVFAKIYISKAIDTVQNLKDSNLDSKRITSRYGLVGIYSDFFEYTLPNLFYIIITLITSITMITFLQPILVFFITPYALIIITTQSIFSKKSQKIEYELQHTREDIGQAIVEHQSCHSILEKQKILMIRKSDIESLNWFSCDLASIIFDVICILYITSSELTLGQITSVLMYANKIFDITRNSFFFFNNIRILQMANDLLNKNK